MNYSAQLQQVWREYEEEHGHAPASVRQVVMWGVNTKRLTPKPTDIYDRLSQDMARALREQTSVDEHGRRYRTNHAVTINENGVQMTLWSTMEDADRTFMQKSFAQRRDQIMGDCYQLATDLEVWNGITTEEPIQMSFDFSAVVDDVIAKAAKAAA